MDFQALIVAVIFVLALLYAGNILRKKISSFSNKSRKCANDCGCDAGTPKVFTQIKRN